MTGHQEAREWGWHRRVRPSPVAHRAVCHIPLHIHPRKLPHARPFFTSRCGQTCWVEYLIEATFKEEKHTLYIDINFKNKFLSCNQQSSFKLTTGSWPLLLPHLPVLQECDDYRTTAAASPPLIWTETTQEKKPRHGWPTSKHWQLQLKSADTSITNI